ncbi:hypothetical protein JYU09_00615 [bacterium AH-315-O15]|nr:hypothetical protein [bacterium AH-315-O15]
MRQRKLDLQARVNGDLTVDFSDVALTSYAGLELFGRYLRRTRFNALVREAFRGTATWGDYGLVAMVRLLLGLLVVGGRRLRHVAYVADDPLFRRFTGLGRMQTARTVSRWLKYFTMTTVGRLQDARAKIEADGGELIDLEAAERQAFVDVIKPQLDDAADTFGQDVLDLLRR